MEQDNVLTGLRTQSTVPLVKREIERMIAAEEIGAGERINESTVANRLNVSRGPVREACRLLEREGLLHSVMNKGFYLRSLSVKEALDLYDVRIHLFGMVGRLAAVRITPPDLDELENLCLRMDEAARAGEIVAFYEFNTRFHQRLVEISDNSKLIEIWPNLENEIQLFRRRGLSTVETMLSSNSEHRQILEALQSGNVNLSERVMGQHIAEGRSRLLHSLEI